MLETQKEHHEYKVVWYSTVKNKGHIIPYDIYSKKFIFYFRFWDRVRRARRVPPLRATVRPISLCRSAASKHITPLQPIAIAAMVVRGDD